MTLEDKVRYYYIDLHYNCAEAVIHAANDYYDLDITKDDMRMLGGFGGGMYAGVVCGVLVAAVAVLSKMVVKESARQEGETVRPVINGMVRSFNQELEGLSCKELRPKYYTKEDSCLKTVLLGTKVLEEAVEKLNNGKTEADPSVFDGYHL
ncbi:MAG: C-GCAxxG-C-C family protein [Erysipelotrichaceae bacterium]|nr:C-GCAxxG-C-C family protein [Erysipelotrichaceae bacterium]